MKRINKTIVIIMLTILLTLVSACGETKAYTVKFFDYDGKMIKSEIVESGEDAIAPENPIRDGYTFTGWDKDYSNVNSDLTITAIYEKNVVKYTVIFQDYNGTELKKVEVIEGEDALAPTEPTRDGYTFKSWDKAFTNVQSDLIITAIYEQIIVSNIYSVEFVMDNGLNQSSSTVQIDSKDALLAYSDLDKYIVIQVYVNNTLMDMGPSLWTLQSDDEEILYIYSEYSCTFIVKGYGQGSFVITNKANPSISIVVDYNILEEVKETGALLLPTSANVDPFDDKVYTGVYFVKNGVNANLTSGGGMSTASSLLYWERIGMEYDSVNGIYKVVSVLRSGEAFDSTFANATYKVAINNNSCTDETAKQIFASTYVGQKVVFNNFDLTQGTFGTGASIMFVNKENPKPVTGGPIVASYVYNGVYNRYGVDELMLDTVDIIYASFVLPNADGSIYVSNSYRTCLNNYLSRAKAKGVKVLLCVGQEGPTYCVNFSKIANNPTLRVTFASNIVKLINEFDLDGVDIDWEYPGYSTGVDVSIDKLMYTELIKEINKQVKANNSAHLVTSAIPAGPWGYVRFDLANSSKYLDYINMMTYDLQCSSNGSNIYHHSALYQSSMTYNKCSVEASVNLFVSQGVDISKLIIGAAFYGRYSTVTSLGGKITSEIIAKTIDYSTIKTTYLDHQSSTIVVYWDDIAKANYIYDSVNNIFVTYESARSITEKYNYTLTKGVAGMMYWSNGEDNTNTLIQAIADAKAAANK